MEHYRDSLAKSWFIRLISSESDCRWKDPRRHQPNCGHLGGVAWPALFDKKVLWVYIRVLRLRSWKSRQQMQLLLWSLKKQKMYYYGSKSQKTTLYSLHFVCSTTLIWNFFLFKMEDTHTFLFFVSSFFPLLSFFFNTFFFFFLSPTRLLILYLVYSTACSISLFIGQRARQEHFFYWYHTRLERSTEAL